MRLHHSAQHPLGILGTFSPDCCIVQHLINQLCYLSRAYNGISTEAQTQTTLRQHSSFETRFSSALWYARCCTRAQGEGSREELFYSSPCTPLGSLCLCSVSDVAILSDVHSSLRSPEISLPRMRTISTICLHTHSLKPLSLDLSCQLWWRIIVCRCCHSATGPCCVWLPLGVYSCGKILLWWICSVWMKRFHLSTEISDWMCALGFQWTPFCYDGWLFDWLHVCCAVDFAALLHRPDRATLFS